LNLEYGTVDNYWLHKKLGRGKYSEVYEASNANNGERCVVKVLKPIKKRKIKKEVKVLLNLMGAPNTVRLLDMVRDTRSKIPCLVFQFISATSWKEFKWTVEDLQLYMYECLKGLDFAHSVGIMHRDIKPDNIMIDHDQRQVVIIDWGLAEFYHPGTEYNVGVATRPFKGPELLVGYKKYDYSLDLWAVGCVMGALIFNKSPYMFYGANNVDQLVKITQMLGTSNLDKYLDKYDIHCSQEVGDALDDCEPQPWEDHIDEYTAHLATKDALNLLESLLQYDHQLRPTCREAMSHKFFASVHKGF
jgi:casein kinase II subunit alpha